MIVRPNGAAHERKQTASAASGCSIRSKMFDAIAWRPSSIQRAAIGGDGHGHHASVKTIMGHTLGHESAQPLPLSRIPRIRRLK